MNINYQLLVDIVLVSGALSFVLNTRSKMIQIIASSTQSNLLIYVGGGGFILLGSFFFGNLWIIYGSIYCRQLIIFVFTIYERINNPSSSNNNFYITYINCSWIYSKSVISNLFEPLYENIFNSCPICFPSLCKMWLNTLF